MVTSRGAVAAGVDSAEQDLEIRRDQIGKPAVYRLLDLRAGRPVHDRAEAAFQAYFRHIAELAVHTPVRNFVGLLSVTLASMHRFVVSRSLRAPEVVERLAHLATPPMPALGSRRWPLDPEGEV